MCINANEPIWPPMDASFYRDRTRQVAFAGYDAILSNQSRGTWRHDAVDMPLSMNFTHMFCKRSRCDGWRTNHEKHFTVHSRTLRHVKHFYMYSVFHRMFKLTDAGVLPPQLMSSYQVYYHKQQANYYIYLWCSLHNPSQLWLLCISNLWAKRRYGCRSVGNT